MSPFPPSVSEVTQVSFDLGRGRYLNYSEHCTVVGIIKYLPKHIFEQFAFAAIVFSLGGIGIMSPLHRVKVKGCACTCNVLHWSPIPASNQVRWCRIEARAPWIFPFTFFLFRGGPSVD